MLGLKNEYVNSLATLCVQNFRAVLPCDKFGKLILKIGDRFIINLATSDEKHGHFVAVSVKDGMFHYFDSYGLSCQNMYVLKAFKQKPHFKIHQSTKVIQGPLSFFCGYFCILFLIFDQMH